MRNKKPRIQYIVAIVAILTMISISITVSLSKTEEEKKKVEEIQSYTLEELPLINDFETLYSLLTFKETKIQNIKDENTVNTVENVTTEEKSPIEMEEEPISEPLILEKTYNNYKYNIENEKIIITNIENIDNPKVVKEISITNTETEKFIPLAMSVNENKLILSGKKDIYKEVIEDVLNNETGENEQKKKYEYENTFSTAKIYDIQNEKKAKLTREIAVEGDYFLAKVYEENLYIISRKNIDLSKYKDVARQNINQDEFKIKYKDSCNEEMRMIEFNQMYYIPNTINNDYFNIVSINLNTEDNAIANSFFGAGDSITISEDNVDIEIEQDEYKDVTLYGYYTATDEIKYIYKFKLENGKVMYKKLEKAL